MTENCPGSGRRTQQSHLTSFPEVKCSECGYYGRPVKRPAGEFTTRFHKPVNDKPDCPVDLDMDTYWPVDANADGTPNDAEMTL